MKTMNSPDHVSEEGARALAGRLKHFWAERGMRIETFVQRTLTREGFPTPYFEVRSNMKNGMPCVS